MIFKDLFYFPIFQQVDTTCLNEKPVTMLHVCLEPDLTPPPPPPKLSARAEAEVRRLYYHFSVSPRRYTENSLAAGAGAAGM